MTNNPGNPIRLDEGHVQRGASGQGPRTPKPDITPKGQGTKGGQLMTQMPTNYDDTLDYCERLLKTIFEEALTLEESTEYKLKEVQVIVAHLSNIEKMKYTKHTWTP